MDIHWQCPDPCSEKCLEIPLKCNSALHGYTSTLKLANVSRDMKIFEWNSRKCETTNLSLPPPNFFSLFPIPVSFLIVILEQQMKKLITRRCHLYSRDNSKHDSWRRHCLTLLSSVIVPCCCC